MTELLLGITIGVSAGLSPGPLLTLVLTTALQRGFGAGVRVACSPLVTDGLVIAIVLSVLSSVPDSVVRLLSAGGGLFVIWLGVTTIWHAGRAELVVEATRPVQRDLWRGVIVNVLSPHPWLFWLGVGGPILVTSWHKTPAHATAFLLGFYGCLIGSKIAVAAAVAAGRKRLVTAWYRRLLQGSGALLLLAGMALVFEATR